MKSLKDQNTNKTSSFDKKITRKKRKKISKSYLINAGVYYLERFPASVAHFRTVMMRKVDRSMEDHPDQDREQAISWLVEEVIPKFIDLGYLNDRQYTRGVVISLRRKGLSRIKILMKLKEKGVDQALANEILSDVDAEHLDQGADHGNDLISADLSAALTYCRRKRMSCDDYMQDHIDDEDAYKLKNKYLGRLARQGFSYDVASRALDMSGRQEE